MAYTTPNAGVIRPWEKSKNRYIHRRAYMVVGTTGTATNPAASGTAYQDIAIPCPGRLVAVHYGKADADNHLEAPIAATGGTLVVKAETEVGVQIFTDTSLNTISTVPVAVGTTALKGARAVTAATDGFPGGFPVRQGVALSVSGGTDGEIIVADLFFRLCTYVKLRLRSQTGADGAGAGEWTVRLGNAGVLAAVAFDFVSMPASTDIVIRGDISTGPILFQSTSSNTDLAPTCIGMVGGDEANAASAATDGTEGGAAFKQGLYISLAEADAFTTGDEEVITELWIDD